MVKKGSQKGRLRRLIDIVRRLKIFLARRHIWSGLLAGFLWAFPAPILLYIFGSFFLGVPYEAIWVLFFPLTSSWQLMAWVSGNPYTDPFALWIMSVFIGMLIGVISTYSIHRIRVWRKTRNKECAQVPSE